jgi:catechol 2,3-dioxygenase-like lactoylglutathione lyase family enzyme
MEKFDIEYIDHVAIRVKDMAASANWYEKVLGLRKYQLPKWGEYPIFMLSKKSGVALFPANLEVKVPDNTSKGVRIDHFAFNVTNENFEKAKKRYEQLKLEYEFEDHFYFNSLYTKDPDGHTVELTTIVVDENTFYNLP